MRILGVGVATLDLILQVGDYPAEDAEIRADGLRRVRGGNVTNTLVVLAGLGHQCDWAGALADEPGSKPILEDLDRHAIGASHAVLFPAGKAPTSYVLASTASGSRTIVHYRDLPEYSSSAFSAIDLSAYDWIHFEGRNPPDLLEMLKRLKRKGGPPCSLEVEKPRQGIDACFAHADTLLFSRHYARSRGCDSAAGFLRLIEPLCPAVPLFCAWGSEGAAALHGSGLVGSPAFVPAKLVETLGAGDVFNAGVIHRMAGGDSIESALDFGCRLAGRKCCQQGFDGLADER